MFSISKIHQVITTLVILTLVFSAVGPTSTAAQGQGPVKQQVNAQTGKVNFIGPENGKVLPAAQALGLSRRPENPGLALAKKYGPEFGLQNAERDLSEIKSKRSEDGRVTVRYQQEYKGIPVLGGELIVNTNDNGDLYSINGEVAQNLTLQTQPQIDSAQAATTALQALAKWYQKSPEDFQTTEPELWIFDESLLGSGNRPAELVWRMEVTPKDTGMPVRGLVLVNAERGSISLHFNQIDTAWHAEAQQEVEQVSNATALVGGTWYVATMGNDTNDCHTTSTPCATINSAIGKAANGDTIKVADGTYFGAGVEVVLINKDIVLSGGWNTNFTIQIGFSTIDGQDARRCITVSSNVITTVENLNIINGIGNPPGGALGGGGIRNGGNLTISNSVLAENTETFANASALYNETGGILVLNKSVVVNNGGSNTPSIIVNQGTFTITESVIERNKGRTNPSNTIVMNTSGIMIITDTTIRDNAGLSISTSSGSLILSSSVVSGNIGWGGIGIGGGTVTINNSSISGNVSQAGGGGLTVSSSNVTINNSTITGNISLNGNSGSSGGIALVYGSSNLTLKNSILARNSEYDTPDCVGSINSGGHNIIGNNSNCTFVANIGDQVGTSNNPINPLLGPLHDNGGFTNTHALLTGSPAINAGNLAVPGSGSNACLAVDQRGIARPIGTICDIGAFEGSVAGFSFPLLLMYTANNSTTINNLILCTQTTLPCTGTDAHADAAHLHAFGTYNLLFSKHGRDSLDNDGMVIISTVHLDDGGLGSRNAYWNGSRVIYGNVYGFPLADDVVAHELTHGMTQHESNLFYWYQSGAINESFSDLWGEYYDQTNGLGTDNNNVKWLLGEDVTGLNPVRSMKNPPQFGDPDKMTSPLYRKSRSDNGGVHHNSGVNNKAVYLMVDGGTFNNKTVTGLGWDKVGAIYYEVNTNLLSSGADYSDLYHALQQACVNLTGQYGILESDCQEVKDALDAVQMNASLGSFSPDAPMCPNGMGTEPSLMLFADDLESGLGNWTVQGDSSWALASGYASSGTSMLWGQNEYETRLDARILLTPELPIPSDGAKTFLHFDHAFLFDYFIYQGTPRYYDGGVLEYSTNGGSTWKDAKPLFSGGKNYGGTLFPYSYNPLGGKSAFVGDSHGYVSSRYNLSSLAGQTVNFRWRLGTDESVAFLGWFVDDIQVYTCVGVPAIPILQAPANNILLTDYTAPLLNWSDTLSGLDHYQVQVATDNTFASPLYDADTGTVSEYQLPADLSPNTTYFWRVRSFNELDATRGWSAFRAFRAAMLRPTLTAPADLAELTIRRPFFDWDAVDGATSYKFQISRKPNLSDPIQNLTVNASEYLPTADLPANTRFFWRVRGLGPNGPSNWSDTFEFTTGKPPSVPSLLKPANNALVKDYTPLFDWSNATVPAGTEFLRYELQVDDNNDFSSPEVQENPFDSTFTPISDLVPNTQYFWRVRAVNSVGGVEHVSSWSRVWRFRAAMLPPVLTTPSDGSVESTRQPVFDWTDVDGATGYTLQIALGQNFGTQLWLSVNVTDSTFALTRSLPRNKLIYWRVRAKGPNGPSNWSDTFDFTSPP